MLLEDSTGTHAIYTTFSKVEMIFHVSTLLGNPQRDRSDPEWVTKISEKINRSINQLKRLLNVLFVVFFVIFTLDRELCRFKKRKCISGMTLWFLSTWKEINSLNLTISSPNSIVILIFHLLFSLTCYLT
jgi:hypothetical protein